MIRDHLVLSQLYAKFPPLGWSFSGLPIAWAGPERHRKGGWRGGGGRPILPPAKTVVITVAIFTG